MNLSILGPPGSGKGTQAVRIAQQLSIVHISTGDMLREAVRQKTVLGRKANEYMVSGRLVPDEVIIGIVKERIVHPDCAKGFLLDGFPRTIPQAEKLDEIGPRLDTVISMEISEEECVRRLANRKSCPKCGMTYNPATHPPKQADQCDHCHTALVLRDDDRPETVKQRLKVYQQQTAPLAAYYQKTKRLSPINASLSPETVYNEIMNLLKYHPSVGTKG
jgi:adenylate kinase